MTTATTMLVNHINDLAVDTPCSVITCEVYLSLSETITHPRHAV